MHLIFIHETVLLFSTIKNNFTAVMKQILRLVLKEIIIYRVAFWRIFWYQSVDWNLTGGLRCILKVSTKNTKKRQYLVTPFYNENATLYIVISFGCTTPKYISFINALTFKEDYAFCFMETSPMTFNYWIDIDFLNLFICNSVKTK